MPTIFNSNVNLSSVQIFLRTLQNETLTIYIEATATVSELKDFIHRKYQIPVVTQQLFHQGRLLKDKRRLSTYKLNAKSTNIQPILLTQSLNLQVFVSQKVLTLSMAINSKNKHYKKRKLSSQQSIECAPNTTVHTILNQLHLSHLSHLIKVCVGAGTDDIKDLNQNVMNIPNILNDDIPILSILFSTRWFLDRTVGIATLSSLMSQTVHKSINSANLLKSCTSFDRLSFQFQKTESFILRQFKQIETMLLEQQYEASKALKWCKKLKNVDNVSFVNQIESKVENAHNTLKSINKKWNKKQTQIVLYLEQGLRDIEDELMKRYTSWSARDLIEWLQYMDERIVITDDITKQFDAASINGYNLSDINQLTLKLMGIKAMDLRIIIIGYIDTLLRRYGNIIEKEEFHFDNNNTNDNMCDNMCCICVKDEVNTVITPCGHAIYCSKCSKKSNKHCNRCPICREKIESIVTVYKAGFNCLEISD